MATSFALLNIPGEAKGYDCLIFETKSGDLTVKALPQKLEDPLFLQMDFPLGNPQKQNFDQTVIDNLLQSLSLDISCKPRDIQFCDKTSKLLLVFENTDTILKIMPSLGDLMKVLVTYVFLIFANEVLDSISG